ncbi:MAG: ATP-binding cassette domain-containing protein [Treponema sp.]|nr:ATP-binding cassette domain-containing protein [Treponema sp.]
MAGIIELNNISFSTQDDKKIIQDVTVSFATGRITAIVGPSGCGKSTILKISAGLLVPTQGDVTYNDLNIAHMNRTETLEFRRRSAFVFQDSALWANQDIFQILELPLKVHYPKMNRNDRVKRIKEVTELTGYRKDLHIRPSKLSMGEQKLIGFARAMLCNPMLLFLDEWVESLDETSAEKLINVVRKKQREGASVIFVCHDMRIIIDLADFIIVIVDGKVTANAPKEMIIGDLLMNDFLKVGIAS